MVRNEPFVTYAVKSVYPYVDKILLYDTGSDDAHTLEDIKELCDNDVENKIVFESVPTEYDETSWTTKTHTRLALANTGKRGKWWVRQKMIDDTDTKFFMILDGDEIHYRGTMIKIQQLINDWPKDKLCGFLPLRWFSSMEYTFKTSKSGRVFVTDEISIIEKSPGEIHTVKKTSEKIGLNSSCAFMISDVIPYAHFEKLIKPWRRRVQNESIFPFFGDLPEVMQDSKIIRRTLSEGPNSQYTS